MLVVVLAVSLGLVALLLIEPLRQLRSRRRFRRWHGYYKN
jgi:hypothetical protein